MWLGEATTCHSRNCTGNVGANCRCNSQTIPEGPRCFARVSVCLQLESFLRSTAQVQLQFSVVQHARALIRLLYYMTCSSHAMDRKYYAVMRALKHITSACMSNAGHTRAPSPRVFRFNSRIYRHTLTCRQVAGGGGAFCKTFVNQTVLATHGNKCYSLYSPLGPKNSSQAFSATRNIQRRPH